MRSIGKLIIKWYLAIGLGVLPFVSWQAHYSPYEVAKGIYLIAFVGGLLALSLMTKGWNKRVDRKLMAAILGVLGMALVSSGVNGTLTSSWWGNTYRFDGLATSTTLVTLAVLIGLKWQTGWQRMLFPIIFLSSVLVTALGIEVGNPNILAGILVTTLPYGYYALREAKGLGKWGWVVLIVWQVWQILSTGSWGGLAGLAVLTAMLGIRAHRLLKWSLLAVLVSLVTGFYLSDFRSSLLPSEVIAESRERILTKGVLAIKEKPLFGWGWAQFATAFREIDWPEPFEVEAQVDRPHSSWLDYGVAMGFPGVFLYGYLIFRAGSGWWKEKNLTDSVCLTALTVYAVHAQTNVVSIAEEALFFLILGIAIARAGRD